MHVGLSAIIMPVIKSPYDPKEYSAIQLENGIVVLLISDKRVARRRGTRRRRVSSSDSEGGGCRREEQESESGSSESDEASSALSDAGSGSSGSEEASKSQQRSEGSADEMENPIRVRRVASLCIDAGSFSDPPDIPGLAHLLEHMVFMGSEKYPGENSFDMFTSRHGGHTNASTDYEKTVYEFYIHQPYFGKALDMFAHFFASPLLLKNSLDREIEAVDSEFQTSIQSDTDRMQQLLCSIAHPDHPFSKFVWGNSESLKKDPREKGIDLAQRLKEFHKRMYSSHYMTVAVMSPDSLDTLEQWARESFSAIPHNQLPPSSFKNSPPAFDKSIFHRLYKVVPVKDTHAVDLTWELPCLFDQYRVKPLHYLGWLLGHEGEGSVLSFLKKRNLATAITAGNSGLGYEYNSCFSLFICTLSLTDKGFDNIFECLTVVFQYLKLLREAGPQERIYQEIQTIEKNEFDFKEEEEPVDYVEKLCESMQFYPEEDFLTGDDLMFEYNPEVIASVQNQLTPEQVNIMLLSKRFAAKCQETEKWFGTQYSSEEIPVEWEQTWRNLEFHPSLHLPPPNIFIATDFALKKPDVPASKYPTLIEECDQYKLWFRQDDAFCNPRAWICVMLKTPLHLQSPENAVLTDLFLNLLSFNVAEIAYAAEVAQLEYSIDVVTRGLTLTLHGLSHKLLLLFENLIDHIVSFSTSQENFDMAKEQIKRNYHNYVLKPKKLCKISRLKVLEFQNWSTLDKMAVIDSVSLESLTDFVSRLKKQLSAETLVQGNMTAQDAKGLMSYLCSHLDFKPLPKSFHVQPRTAQLPANTHVSYRLMNRDQQSPNTAIVDYYQCSLKTTRDSVMSGFIARSMEEPCFDILRTKQQLGYEVYCQHHSTHGVVGLSLTLVTQGSKYSVDYASRHMDSFMVEFCDTLRSWSKEEFQTQVEALILERLEPDISLEEEVARNWAEIVQQRYEFDRLKKEVEGLRSITQDEACAWLEKFTRPGKQYRKFSIIVMSHNVEAVIEEFADNPDGVPPCKEGFPMAIQESSVDPPILPNRIAIDDDVDSFKRTLYVYPSCSCPHTHTS